MNNNRNVLKVLRGTPDHSQAPLCNSCSHAQIMQGYSESQRKVWCGYMSERIRWPIYRCSAYYNSALPSLDDMKRTAWILCTKKAGREIGFMSAKEYQEQQRKETPSWPPGREDWEE